MEVSWRFIDLTLRYELIVMAVLVGLTAAFAPSLALGTAAGGAIAFLNIYGSKVLLPKAVTSPGQVHPGYSLLLMMKFMVTFTGLAIVYFVFRVDPLGLAIGFGGCFFLGTGFALAHTIVNSPAPESI
ncbi:MAG: ATP synthase subunit I [Myxococcota bacterium]